MARLPPKSSQPVPRNADLDARDESGWLPVHWAAQSGSVETMCNLHYLGADFVSRWIWRWMIFFGMNQTRSSFLAKPVDISIFFDLHVVGFWCFGSFIPVNYSPPKNIVTGSPGSSCTWEDLCGGDGPAHCRAVQWRGHDPGDLDE